MYSLKFEQIPLFYPRGSAAPLQGIAAIATLERFVLYCSSELIISGSTPVSGPEGMGNCSSCYKFLHPFFFDRTCMHYYTVCPWLHIE